MTTKEERQLVGAELRALRIRHALKQIDVARKADLSVGTVQAIEHAKYENRDTNLEKYAGIFGTSVRKLLAAAAGATEITPTNPLLKDLHEEHLEIARLYMQAKRRVRAGIEALLQRSPSDEALATVLLKLVKLPDDQLRLIDAQLDALDNQAIAALIVRLVRRFLADPPYMTGVADGLTLYEQLPAAARRGPGPAKSKGR